MKKIISFTGLVAALAAAVLSVGACTWKFDTTWHAGDTFSVETFHTDGVIVNGVLSPAPAAGLTVRSDSPQATYTATWRVPGGDYTTESGLVAGTPRPFTGIPATKGTHVLEGEVWDDAAPGRTVPYTIEYSVTAAEGALDGTWTVTSGSLKYGDDGSVVPDVEPDASVTLTQGDPESVYDLRWTVAPDWGGEYREASDVKLGTPFRFPDLPMSPGTHVVSGRIYERGNPDRFWPFEFQYTITSPSQKDLVFEPTSENGSYELPGTEPVLRSHPSAGLRALAGDAAFDVAYSVDGADSLYLRGVPGGSAPVAFDLTGHEGIGTHRVRGTVRELSGNREVKPFDIPYDMGCALVDGGGTPAVSFFRGQLSLDLRTNSGKFVRQEVRAYDMYSAPVLQVLRTPASGNSFIAVCRDASGTVRRLSDGGLFKTAHRNTDPFGDLGVTVTLYELSPDGAIVSCEDAGSVPCCFVARQIIYDGSEGDASAPRLAGVAVGSSVNGSFGYYPPSSTGVYSLYGNEYIQLDVQIFVTEESNMKSPFLMLLNPGALDGGLEYVCQSDSPQVISTFSSEMSRNLYSTVSYYRLKVPSGVSSGTARLTLSDGVNLYRIEVPWTR